MLIRRYSKFINENSKVDKIINNATKNVNRSKSFDLINENLDQAKKLLKDTFILSKAAKEITKMNTDWSGFYLFDKKGEKVLFYDLPEDVQEESRKKYRDIKVTEEEARMIGKSYLQTIRQIIGDKLGYAYLFTYLYLVEKVPVEELRTLLAQLVEFNDLLGKLRRPIGTFIDTKIKNNAEQLGDDLEDIRRYRKLKRFLDEFTPELKKDFMAQPLGIKNKLTNIATAFDELGKEDGKIDLEKQKYTQKRFFDKLKRYKTTKETILAAEAFLKAEANASNRKFYLAIEATNKKFGEFGVNVLFDEKGIMVMEVRSFQACKALFSNTSWCIASSQHQWDSYVGGESKYTKQYSILNFNLSPADNKSMIGITIGPNKSIDACHAKDDGGIGRNAEAIFNQFEKASEIEIGMIWHLLAPMSKVEQEKKKKRIVANKELAKRNVNLDLIKKYVVEDGGDINTANGQALDYAVEDNDKAKVKFLLEMGADPNLRNKQDATINDVTDFEMLKLLVDNGADLTHQALVNLNIISDYDAVKYCLDNGLDPNFEDNMPIRMAIKSKPKAPGEDLKIVKLLVHYGSNVNSYRMTTVKHAAELQKWDMVDFFVDHGCTQNFDSVLEWVGHCVAPEEVKLKILDKCQRDYLDTGKCTASEKNYKVRSEGGGRNKTITLEEVLDKYGSVKNYVIATNEDLAKYVKDHPQKKS